MIILIIKSLINSIGIMTLLAFLMSKTNIFKKIIIEEDAGVKGKILLVLVFGLYGIMGTYTGIEIQGALANTRVIGVFVGGLLGGPLVGFLAGLMAGIHRYAIEPAGFTALACAIATIVEGSMGGFLKKSLDRSKNRVEFALYAGMFAEVIQMAIILLLARPFPDALRLVRVIAFPMIITNGIGIAILTGLINNIFSEIEMIASYQARLSLKIANKTLAHLRKGLNEETAYETAKIIKEMTGVKAVAFTSGNKILAHVGLGEDHHLKGMEVMTSITKKVLTEKDFHIAKTKKDIGCDCENCSLKSAIIAPIMEGRKVIGLLKIYKDKENAISPVEIELAKGLVLLFANQIELSKLEEQKELLAEAELKALQAQINPHFLFNAINTIVSLTRIDPNSARKLLIHLGDYFRNNLQESQNLVSLSKELENINSYIEIEKARFGDKLEVIYDIEECTDCTIAPLILQPIVENAIKHGVLEKLEGGTVEIKARNMEEETILIVRDNGVGIDEEKLKNILIKGNQGDSIGLLNTNNRLINKYGEDYGLKIESELGKGTCVTIRIPKDPKEMGGREVA